MNYGLLNCGLHAVVMGVPDFPKPEIKTVMAEKIFDTPGRSERPSHVRIHACTVQCMYMYVCIYVLVI